MHVRRDIIRKRGICVADTEILTDIAMLSEDSSTSQDERRKKEQHLHMSKMNRCVRRSARIAVTSVATSHHPQLMSTSVQEIQQTESIKQHFNHFNTLSSSLCEPR